jgi:cell division transport system permease protein
MKSRKGFTSVTVHVTATVSVALVLLLLGIVATLGLAASSITTDIKEHLGFDVILKESATADQVNAFKQQFAKAPYVASFVYHSPEEAMNTWQAEMGEDLVQLLEVNPFLPEFEVNLRANYACADSLDAIVLPLQKQEQVQEVNVHTEMVDSVNRNISTLMLVLIVAACALTPISFVLINNTVRLTIYSHRFTIHTMKLVGASRGFIRRPFMLSNLLQGALAAVVASALLAAMASYVFSLDPSLQAYVGWEQLAVVFAALLVIGILICLLAAWSATQRYLTRSYDELFN